MNRIRNAKYILTLFTSLVTLFLSIFSLINKDIYTERINRISQYELMGQDIVTAIISTIFIGVILFKDYNHTRIKVIWLGCLMYLFYIYAYFSFGGISSIFYLAYITVTGISLFLFFSIISDIFKNKQFPRPASNYPRKSISIFLFICIGLVGTIEIVEIFLKTILSTEKINPFFVFYVLDLSIIFPLIIIAAVLNYKKSVWGYLLSGIALLKIITILPAVIFNDIFHRIFVGHFLDLPFDIIAVIITLTGLVFTKLYMKRVD